MRYDILISITRHEIERIGLAEAVAKTKRDAWGMAADKKPQRSITLHSVMIDEYEPPGPSAYRYRFVFEVE